MGDLTNKNEEVEFDWITLRKDMGDLNVIETSKEKMIRKIKENPLVPIGCLATACALTYGLWSFHKGDRKMSQYMMRTRIVAQGFTVFALVVGIGMTAAKHVYDKSFTQKYILTVHTRIHTEYCPYVFRICSRDFNVKTLHSLSTCTACGCTWESCRTV